MGGIGSGRHSWQDTMENTSTLDVRWFNKKGLFKHPRPYQGSLEWTRNGNSVGGMGYKILDDRMILMYKHRNRQNLEWEEVEQTIYFDETPCNYGGTRKWFLCPNCLKRVAVLAGLGKYFYCRKCYRLPYRSTLETKRDRVFTKKHELGAQIFEHYQNGDGWQKKKGMHWKTFHKKYSEYNRLREITDEIFIEQAHKICRKT